MTFELFISLFWEVEKSAFFHSSAPHKNAFFAFSVWLPSSPWWFNRNFHFSHFNCLFPRSDHFLIKVLILNVFALISIDLYWFELICIGLNWFLLVWTDLNWFELIWTDLNWFLLICMAELSSNSSGVCYTFYSAKKQLFHINFIVNLKKGQIFDQILPAFAIHFIVLKNEFFESIIKYLINFTFIYIDFIECFSKF